jgi:CheY-like chemotaxis protein
VPTRIVLVDDHAIMRQGLRAVLEREPDLHVVGEAATPADAVAAVAAARPHVVLLDLKLTAGPQTDGLDVCRRLCALHPGDSVAQQDLPSMLRRLSAVHMPDELRVEVRIGGVPVPLPAECEQSLFRVAGEALFNTAVHADASRAVVRLAYGDGQVRLTIADDGRGRPEEVRRSLRAASVACPSGEHRGLVNMAARARELGGTLTFRRSRLGGLQVQVDIPTPCATSAARLTAAGTRVAGR